MLICNHLIRRHFRHRGSAVVAGVGAVDLVRLDGEMRLEVLLEGDADVSRRLAAREDLVLAQGGVVRVVARQDP